MQNHFMAVNKTTTATSNVDTGKLNYSRNPELLPIYSSKTLHRITAWKEICGTAKTNDSGKTELWLQVHNTQLTARRIKWLFYVSQSKVPTMYNATTALSFKTNNKRKVTQDTTGFVLTQSQRGRLARAYSKCDPTAHIGGSCCLVSCTSHESSSLMIKF